MFCMSMELVEEAEVKVVFWDGKITNKVPGICGMTKHKDDHQSTSPVWCLHFERFGPNKIATTEGDQTTEKESPHRQLTILRYF